MVDRLLYSQSENDPAGTSMVNIKGSSASITLLHRICRSISLAQALVCNSTPVRVETPFAYLAASKEFAPTVTVCANSS